MHLDFKFYDFDAIEAVDVCLMEIGRSVVGTSGGPDRHTFHVLLGFDKISINFPFVN